MNTALARAARGLIAVTLCMICGSTKHEQESCPHRWDFHRGGAA